jgi:hypothetical protein
LLMSTHWYRDRSRRVLGYHDVVFKKRIKHTSEFLVAERERERRSS